MIRRRSTVRNVTSAPTGHRADLRSREVRYLWSMAVRTACFLGGLAASGPLRWTLFAAAIFLPYVAVLIANAGRDARRQPHTPYTPPKPELEPAGSRADPELDSDHPRQ